MILALSEKTVGIARCASSDGPTSGPMGSVEVGAVDRWTAGPARADKKGCAPTPGVFILL
jgi:hypothetical protein